MFQRDPFGGHLFYKCGFQNPPVAKFNVAEFLAFQILSQLIFILRQKLVDRFQLLDQLFVVPIQRREILFDFIAFKLGAFKFCNFFCELLPQRFSLRCVLLKLLLFDLQGVDLPLQVHRPLQQSRISCRRRRRLTFLAARNPR